MAGHRKMRALGGPADGTWFTVERGTSAAKILLSPPRSAFEIDLNDLHQGDMVEVAIVPNVVMYQVRWVKIPGWLVPLPFLVAYGVREQLGVPWYEHSHLTDPRLCPACNSPQAIDVFLRLRMIESGDR